MEGKEIRKMERKQHTSAHQHISRGLCLLGALGISVTFPGYSSEKQDNKGKVAPHIILIVADDFGYGDLSCYGATKINTPQVDKLAKKGVRFTDAYVTSSLCSPSRYSLLTGRYSWRTELKSGVLESFAPPLIEEGRTTLASMLKQKGYHTACVGKWHLGFNWALKDNAPPDADTSVFKSWGTEPQNYIDFAKPVKGGPVERGFDYFFGISGANNMMPFVLIENDRVLEPPSVMNEIGTRALRAPNYDLRYLDQKFTAKANEVIDNHFKGNNKSPLFLYFPVSAIHRPCLPTFTKGKSQAGLRGDMVLEFDHMVGELVKAMEKNSAMENTMIIITSDNGPQPGDPYAVVQKIKKKAFGEFYDFYPSNFIRYKPEYPGNGNQETGWIMYDHNPTAGLFGFKGDAWEGGLRVPLIVYWPGKINKGSVNHNMVCNVDILATIADLLSVDLTEKEGEDSYSFLQNILDSKAPQVRTSLTLVSGRSGALTVRKDGWKYIEGAVPQNIVPNQPFTPNNYENANYLDAQLFNLNEDVNESKNLFGKRPDKVAELSALIEKVKTSIKSESYINERIKKLKN